MPDPDALAAAHAAAFSGPARWSAAAFAEAMRDPLCFFVPPPAGGADGFALGRTVADEAELLTLLVDPAWRSQGAGRRLLAQFEAEAQSRGAARAFLEVAADNTAALSLYHSAGWRETGRRPGYYEGVDALAMGKALVRPPTP